MTCIVCDNPNGGYCEFCSTPLDDDDLASLRMTEPPTVRSYRATYKRLNIEGLDGLFFRDLDATTFTDAVWTAEHQREDGTMLMNVRTIEDLDPVILAHA